MAFHNTGYDNFETLYKDHYYGIRRYLLRLTRDVDRAEDLTSDFFVRIFKKGAKYNKSSKYGNGNLKAWMFKVAYNIFINHYRKEKRFQKHIENKQERVFYWSKGIDPDYMEHNNINAINAEKRRKYDLEEKVNEAVEHLIPVFQQVIVLRYLRDESYKEISETLNIPIGTTMSRLWRAHRQMKKYLNKKIK